jgi:hypothetical protein
MGRHWIATLAPRNADDHVAVAALTLSVRGFMMVGAMAEGGGDTSALALPLPGLNARVMPE